jgi:hypothetical protein
MEKREWFLIIFNLIYIIPFTVYYILKANYEFLVYVLVLILIFILVAIISRKIKFGYLSLWGLSLWGLMHMAGGGLIINGDVLYALKLIKIIDIGDTYLLKYDQLVHAYLYFVVVFLINDFLKLYINRKIPRLVYYGTITLLSVSIGALNEIVEFSTVLFFGNTGVGGYFNNSIDLVANTLGAILGSWVLYLKRQQF